MKYPLGVKTKYNNIHQYGNRGMSLENDINLSNEYYRHQDIAIIYKKPTPITIAKVDYKSRQEAIIKEAYFKTPSTTDYNGIYQGKYLDFEAKETKLSRFPLSNIHQHQIRHLEKIIYHGGIGFLIIRFTKYEKTYLLTGEKFLAFIKEQKVKSIPITYFEQYGYQIIEKWNPRLPYIEIVNQIYFKGEKL